MYKILEYVLSYCKGYFQWKWYIKGTKRGEKSGKNFEDRFHTSTSNEIFFRKDKSFRVCMKMFISKIKINDFSKIWNMNTFATECAYKYMKIRIIIKKEEAHFLHLSLSFIRVSCVGWNSFYFNIIKCLISLKREEINSR